MKELILIRGCSGSGKTTLAQIIAQKNFPVYSADDYFMVDGEYKFDGSKLKNAHEYCHTATENAMLADVEGIIVANTFTREWEMERYFELAEKYGYRVHSVVVENRHGNSNVHGVPVESVDNMRKRFEIKL